MIRKIVFWTHLVSGISAGIAIAIMSFTGAALAFDKDLVAWAERDARRVELPTGAPSPLPIEDLVQRVQTAQPDVRITTLALTRDPRAAVALGLPGNKLLHANPYTGELREGHAPGMRAFVRTMQAWHIRLNFMAGPDNAGRKINSASNLLFLFLCVSGLVLWWPRMWNSRALRPALWFVRGARGRARDWNWHNVIGFWSLPILVILVASGVVLSYRWAGDLVFRLAGETPPAAGSAPRPATASPAAARTPKPAGGRVLPFTTLRQRVEEQIPQWEQITFRFSPPLLAGAAGGDSVTAVVRADRQWPFFANTTLTLDGETGAVRRTEVFRDQSAGQQARRWVRLLHTGEAFGGPGQLVAGIASLGGVMLVWTGLALAWRRFFGGSKASSEQSH